MHTIRAVQLKWSREGEMASGRGMDKGCPWNGLEGLYVYRTEKVLPSGPWRASVKPQSGGKWAWKLELGIINNLSWVWNIPHGIIRDEAPMMEKGHTTCLWCQTKKSEYYVLGNQEPFEVPKQKCDDFGSSVQHRSWNPKCLQRPSR